MTQFKVGDRVAVYDAFARHVGKITKFMQDTDAMYVDIDAFTIQAFHQKQCRKLVKKKRRSVWIDPKAFETAERMGCFVGTNLKYKEGCIEFREVKK